MSMPETYELLRERSYQSEIMDLGDNSQVTAPETKRRGQEYLEMSKMQQQGITHVLDEFSNVFNEMQGTCLVLGCKAGSLLKDKILPKLAKDAVLVGADVADDILEHAKKNCSGEKRISFKLIDIGGMRIPNEDIEKYDNIISFYYLETFQNMSRLVRHMSRMLKPRGQGLVMILSHHDIYDLHLTYRANPNYGTYMEDIFFQLPALFGLPNAAQIVRDNIDMNGLKTIDCKVKELSITYSNTKDLEYSLMTMDPFVHRMPDDVQEKYKKEFIEEYVGDKMKNGEIIDTYRVVIAQFQKA
ncbi:uncharacterized protein [Fopius arisanus]|uniref:Methyltransferase type 12 domain-containing protein n=1 Tax=Fopius arisanus TaxID=64838 RepID=A0A9R1T0G3_9HYME|nr:PREDICTED: uncharacterized protein LOC105264933 [Fopius arisanus]XP_011300457.1 PREDICTED: uncharacterized protein LOC105264933 [Fopius arisanus]